MAPAPLTIKQEKSRDMNELLKNHVEAKAFLFLPQRHISSGIPLLFTLCIMLPAGLGKQREFRAAMRQNTQHAAQIGNK